MDEMKVPAFEQRDYLQTTQPYEWLMQYEENQFLFERARELLRIQAQSVKIRGFTKLLNSYLQTAKKARDIVLNNSTNFTGQPMELLLPPEWEANDSGISIYLPGKGQVYACNHPIMPIQRLINIDSETEKIKLAYCKKYGGVWRYIIVDKKTIASRQSIVQLSEFGIGVNSENSGLLVKYLTDAESYNIETIPEISSVGRLGWMGERGFSPFVGELVFDGELAYKNTFNSISKKGAYDKWLDIAKQARNHDIVTRIVLAAAFASVLVAPCNALPFFVHTWGGSEAGKTVALILATSVWANPEKGAYWYGFNSTEVGHEAKAGFLNSLPLIIDELQIEADRKSFDRTIYALAEGIGRARGNRDGGLRNIRSWHNCILTSGEMPITNPSSAGGAVNRVIEIDCKGRKLFPNPKLAVAALNKNYGFAGEIFIEKLQNPENMELAIKKQQEYYEALDSGNTTEKQAASGSLILTADYLISKWIFQDNIYMLPKDIEPFLLSKSSMSVNDRAYEFLIDFVNIHRNNFERNASMDVKSFEVWGMVKDDVVFIIKTIFDRIMQQEGYSPTAFLSWAKETGHIKVAKSAYAKGSKRNTVMKRLDSTHSANCVCLVLPPDDMEDDIEDFDANDGDLEF